MPSALSHSFLRGARFTPVLVLHVPGMKRRKSFPSPGNWGLRCLPWRWWEGSLSSASLAWSRCQAVPQSLWGNRRAEGGPAAGKCTERMGNEGRGEVALPGQRTALTALPAAPWGWQPHGSGSVFGLGALSSSTEQREPCRNPEPELGEEETLLAKEEGRVSKKTLQKVGYEMCH